MHKQLFEPKLDVYAVVDGASVPALLAKLEEYEPKHSCLFRGELPFDLAEAAPYLIKLEEDNEFTYWLLSESAKEPCCIYAQTTVIDDFIALRKHFRSFLRVEAPDKKKLLFRYYDPRVFKTYLPTCNHKENKVMFKHIDSYLLLNDDDQSFQRFKMPSKEEIKIEPKKEIDVQSDLPEVNETKVEEEKTVIMRVSQPSQKTSKKSLDAVKVKKLPSAEDVDPSEAKTVIMRIKPKS